jgi:hypothetical protein
MALSPKEMKVQVRGLAFVGVVLFAASVILVFFLSDMADNALMGASPKYKPNFPAVPVTDITQAPQCLEGYDKPWIGCQKLAE